MEERIQKILSAAGVCSRRAAEKQIQDGCVRVNGVRAVLGMRADPERDLITLNGVPVVRTERPAYLLLNKPRGYVTTLRDVRGCGVRVYPVGRLDLQSEGLVLMTNDGALMQALIHPSHQVDKTYRVSVRGAVDGAAGRLCALRRLEDGTPIAPARVEEESRTGPQRAVLSITIYEGKNRQIRRMCALCGLQVQRLQRIREHTLEIGTLGPGQWRWLSEQEVCALKSESDSKLQEF